MSLSGAWVGGTQGAGSTVGLCARGGVELEDARLGLLSKAIISAMLEANRSTVPWRVVTLPSSVAMRVMSWEGISACVAGGGGAYTGGGGNPE
ncbi:hypothetical protein CDL15_Pgr026308 [Punica granatum]|uniref:Uncharacterized protein n=1 Tax=Punica granatum TaxID=22663 RepID=A0A218XVF3_PUNGR|nr:hypothetical protein CDL15_Pgr026308 [Punica granatum]